MRVENIPHLIMNPFSFTLLLFTLLNLTFCNAICNENDKNILLQIKAHFNNPSSLSSWNASNDCDLWFDIESYNNIGVNDQGRVFRVRISNALDIHGTIPTFLDQLPFLTVLDFSGIPNLSGPIPSSIGNLAQLIQLFITSTSVTGPIPTSLGRLTKLASLDLHSNKLNGPIPSSLAQLSELESIRLSDNHFSGSIPDFLGRHLKKLNYIGIESNQFSGPIPASLGLLTRLTTLLFAHNKLTGPIPNPLGQVNVINSVDLSYNSIAGDASFLFDKKYTGLLFLYVNNNMLKFDFSNVDLTPTLAIFNISHNMIYGSLPKRFGQMQPDLNHVDVSYNQLCGPIPNGRRFKKADPTIFAYNKCLCGGPLPPCKE